MLLALCFITLPFKTRTAAQPNKTKTKQAPRRSTKKNKFFLLRQALVCRKKLWPTNRRHISTCTQNGTRQPSKKAPPGAIAMGTRPPTKQHELESANWHEGVRQKARTGAHEMAQRSTPKSTNWSKRNGTKEHAAKHEMEHKKWHTPTHQRHELEHSKRHEGAHKKHENGAQSIAQRNPPKQHALEHTHNGHRSQVTADSYK